MTAQEIRTRILETVSKNGGHLASSLGAVEIALALYETFDAEKDRILWDVGHQAYAWKILTGRAESFGTLRKLDGISGFPNPAESKADPAVSGHAGTALSVAEGLAIARDRRGGDEEVIAVIGDGAIVNGTSFEAFNSQAGMATKVIIVLNDNEMSISQPAGSFSRFLGRLTSGRRYNRIKDIAKRTLAALRLSSVYSFCHWAKGRLKSMFLANTFFERFGFHYLGPVDGHNLKALKNAFAVAKDEKRSVIVHVVTKKGKGFAPAEKDPVKWHGTGPFAYPPSVDSVDLTLPSEPAADAPRTWSDAFGDALSSLAREDDRIIALTAGMTDGTGLAGFAAEFPKRFFDVGIAEGHMAAFAGGLASGGFKPVVAVYSTFLQRAVDQIMQDIAIAKLPVVICVDRAGVVGADGVTHQGLYDIAMLRCLPNIVICQPKDEDDFRALLKEAINRNGPTVIRYPRGKCAAISEAPVPSSAKTAIWTTGDWYAKACEVAKAMGETEVVQARYIKPFDSELLKRQRAARMRIVSLENGSLIGGLGDAIGADEKFGWPDEFIPHGSPEALEKRYGLDVDSIISRLRGKFNG